MSTINLGIHKNLTLILWFVLIGSISSGIYKNFTAIDWHTVHEIEVIETKISDTNRIESFMISFTTYYYTWRQNQAVIDCINEQLTGSIIEALQQLNLEIVRSDITDSATVQHVQIWEATKETQLDFQVVFLVNQLLAKNEKK